MHWVNAGLSAGKGAGVRPALESSNPNLLVSYCFYYDILYLLQTSSTLASMTRQAKLQDIWFFLPILRILISQIKQMPKDLNHYTFDTTEKLEDLLTEYKEGREPIHVSYRQLIPDIKSGERYTHLIHKYPAKLLMQIPAFYLANTIFAPSGGEIYDPFSGSGTVALETLLSGRKAILCDSNPLARLIAKTKIELFSPASLESELESIIHSFELNSSGWKRPNVVNLDYWYDTRSIKYLAQLKCCILNSKNSSQGFFLVCLSALAQKLSYTDPRLSVPVKSEKPQIATPNRKSFIDAFLNIARKNIQRSRALYELGGLKPWRFAGNDSRNILDKQIPDCSIDAIITSPPYAGAQKYIRASGLSLGWLDYAGNGELRPLEKITIGREHLTPDDRRCSEELLSTSASKILKIIREKNPERHRISLKYLLEMEEVINSCYRILKPNGSLLMVIGDNTVAGQQFQTSKYIVEICLSLGFKIKLETVDHIVSRSLMTKRNKTAGIIAKEHVIWMEK